MRNPTPAIDSLAALHQWALQSIGGLFVDAATDADRLAAVDEMSPEEIVEAVATRVVDRKADKAELERLRAENDRLLTAVEAMVRWFVAEDQHLGTFHDRMDLCAFTEWTARKALGQEVGEFKGVPRLILQVKPGSTAEAAKAKKE